MRLNSNAAVSSGRRGVRRAFVAAVALAVVLVGSASSWALSSSAANPFVPIVKKASPAVVNIDVETKAKRSVSPFPFEDDPIFRRFFGDAFKDFTKSVPMKGRGSGFIVTKDGQILTNNHVVDGADKITVSVSLSDGSKKTYSAKVLGNDRLSDLALIKITPDEELSVLELGNSDEVEVGELVIAIGNPYGFEHSITTGVISAKNRSVHAQDVNFDGFLQTDAAINPGNSGGPLLNMDGKVIGINTAIIPYAQGIGFAIPINKAKGRVMSELVAHGKVKRGWLGVSIQNITPEIAKVYGVKTEGGVIISEVFRDSAAQKAGLRRGDAIVELNGEQVKNVEWFVQKVQDLAPNARVKLQIIRGGKRSTVDVKLDERPNSVDGRQEVNSSSRESSSENDVLDKVGLKVASVTSGLRRMYRLDSDAAGLVVINVSGSSPASSAGIREGDMILQVNGQDVRTMSELEKAAQGSGDFIVLMIGRQDSSFIVSLKKGD